MPEVRRRSATNLIGSPSARTFVGADKGAGLAVTVARLGAKGGGVTRRTSRAASLAFGTERTGSSDVEPERTPALEAGIWLIDATVIPHWTTPIGVMQAAIETTDNNDISGPHFTQDGIEQTLWIPPYRFVSNGTQAVTVDAVYLSGSYSAVASWTVTATYLGPVE